MSIRAHARFWAAPGFLAALAVSAVVFGVLRSTPPAPVEASGCEEIARWKFNDGSGTTADDSVGSYDGSIGSEITWKGTGCKEGSCLEFQGDGGGDMVSVSMAARTGNWTISAWVYPDETPMSGDDDWSTPPAGGGCSGFGGYYAIAEWDNDNPFFGVTSQGFLTLYPNTVSSTEMSHDAWHHVAYTWDGTTGTVYLDGTNVGTSDINPSSGGFSLGIGFGSCDTGWQGRIDDVRIFDKALSASQIGNINGGSEPAGCGGGAVCGNGTVETGEACDDGNSSNNDACLNTCVAATCGDGYVKTGSEQCDDGNASNTDACVSGCNNARCGDGYVRANVEQCDDGNQNEFDSCTNSCVVPSGGGGGSQPASSVPPASSSAKPSSSAQASVAPPSSSSASSGCELIERVQNGRTVYSFRCPQSSEGVDQSAAANERKGHCCDSRTGTYLGYVGVQSCAGLTGIEPLVFMGPEESPPAACTQIRYCQDTLANCFYPYNAANEICLPVALPPQGTPAAAPRVLDMAPTAGTIGLCEERFPQRGPDGDPAPGHNGNAPGEVSP